MPDNFAFNDSFVREVNHLFVRSLNPSFILSCGALSNAYCQYQPT